MKTVGIIAEYNPFHKGHKLHIEKSRKITGADFVIVLMSGDFTQRGEPALFDKYTRARMALLNGADLVLELPSHYALSSAEGFASGGVSILDRLGVVDHLSFGSECGDLPLMDRAARVLLDPDPAFDAMLKKALTEGVSYPKAVSDTLTSLHEDPSLFSGPNNILGIEYLKALRRADSRISPVTVEREDNGFSNEAIDQDSQYASARSIRKALLSSEEGGAGTPVFKNYVCENTLPLFDSPKSRIDDYSALLYYKLLSEREKGYEEYSDVSRELSDKIRKNLRDYTTFSEFILLLKAKNYTYVRIARALFHILLGMHELSLPAKNIRILGFREGASALLHEIKKSPEISLISKPADAPEDPFLQKDLECAFLYEQVNGSYRNELRTSPVLLP
ncbi:MAG: nucleotidyltransferase family protein [Lachnospiraceae bacterium]|nr:nucleotidyltransferase family protein [Lachnospiraceae bacterium]